MGESGEIGVGHLLAFLAGAGIGAAVLWGYCRGVLRDLRNVREDAAERSNFLEQAQSALSDTFKALSADALKSNQESFLGLANENLGKFQQAAKGDLEKRQQAIGELVKPVEKSLKQVDEKIHQLEKQRRGAYAELREQVVQMAEAQKGLKQETGQLVKALRRPTGRGQWGELQLQRVVELAGMQEHCDFLTQVSSEDDEGRRLRPDMIVRLPGGRQVVVDSKAP
ncbi:MAG: DNA recombination protein RmuC, partial [Verrucomicrobiales bacterium]